MKYKRTPGTMAALIFDENGLALDVVLVAGFQDKSVNKK